MLASGPAGALDVPGTDGRVTAGGWLDGRAVVDTGGGERQRPQARLSLDVTARLARRLRLVTETRARAGGPFEGGDGIGVYDFSRTFQNVSPAFEFVQAYGEWRGRVAEMRAGIQTFAWGKLDGLPPTDVVNPRDYHDPLVDEAEERKIGVPALSTTIYPPLPQDWPLSGLRAMLAWIPWAVPSRLALQEERWFPSSTAPPDAVGPALLEQLGLPRELAPIPIRFGTRNDGPARTFEHGALAARLSGTAGTVDWSLYHYTGQETGPNADLVATVGGRLDRLRVDAALEQATDTMHMTGADLAVVLGPVAVRAEVAHFLDRPYLRPAGDLIDELDPLDLDDADDLIGLRVPLGDLFSEQDAVEWGIGADAVWRGFRPLIQVSQVIITDRAPRLLIADPETRVVGRLEKGWMADRLTTEVQVFWAAERGSWFTRPEVSYLVRDDLRLGVAYLAVGGPATSLIGQFKRNDEVLFLSRWSF